VCDEVKVHGVLGVGLRGEPVAQLAIGFGELGQKLGSAPVEVACASQEGQQRGAGELVPLVHGVAAR
jgi:hypothetical protein